jgi:hypothetical protein
VKGCLVKFLNLVSHVSQVDSAARTFAGHRLQQILSLRNWLIGAHIVEFEQDGEDRAAYGQRLLQKLADELRRMGYAGLALRNLKNFRQVTMAYPLLDPLNLSRRIGFSGIALTQAAHTQSASPAPIRQASAELAAPLSFPKLEKQAPAQGAFPWRDADWLSRLFTTLTFSHLLELARIEDPVRRSFYELHCLKERWSCRELQRQRDSMLYERIGIS